MKVIGSNSFSLKDHKELTPRIDFPKRKYSIETVHKLIGHKYVLISSESSNNRMINHYNQYNLIEAGDDIYTSFTGIAVRKTLEKKIKL
jgi:hypothetical protein